MADPKVDSVTQGLSTSTGNEKLAPVASQNDSEVAAQDATKIKDTPENGQPTIIKDVKNGEKQEQGKIEALKTSKSQDTQVKDTSATTEADYNAAKAVTETDAKSDQQATSGKKATTINQENRPDFSRNVKTDFSSLKQSSDPEEIRKQVEFYFSDSNLHTDKFLFSKVQGHRNLPVPIGLLHSFKRMRHFQPFLAIVDALKDSKFVQVVDGDKVQRREALPEEIQGKEHAQVQRVYEDAAMARSIYVKGFGEEKPTTQFDLEAFFTPHGPYNSVRLRRRHDKIFKGSVFVEFETDVIAKAFVALDPKPKWEGEELLIKSKKQYCDEKSDEIDAGRIRAKPIWKQHAGKDWKTRKAEDQKNGSREDRGGRGGRGRGRGHGQGNRGSRTRTTEEQATLKRMYGRAPEVVCSTPASEASKSGNTNAGASEMAEDSTATVKSKGDDASAVSAKEGSASTKRAAEEASIDANLLVKKSKVEATDTAATTPSNGALESKKRSAEESDAKPEKVKKAKVAED